MQPSCQDLDAPMPEAVLAKQDLASHDGCTSVNYNQYVTCCVRGQQFVVPRRYKIGNCIGSGSYGIVVAAYDNERQEHVAIKKICNVFGNECEFAKRILREIATLKHFCNHDNIVQLKNFIRPPSYEEFRDVYICTDLMDRSLRCFLGESVALTEQRIQFLLYQILRALKCIHSANVLHRDIKPQNILINYNFEVKICDFGLACGQAEEHANMSTYYVASRWYRAPELLLCHKEANKALDMWSIGCVFAEMLNSGSEKLVLFQGESYLHQIDLILHLLGTPCDEDIRGSPKAINYVKNRPRQEKKDLRRVFPRANALALDLLSKMLQFNPDKRISVDEALNHPYLQNMVEPDEEPIQPLFDLTIPSNVTMEELKSMMFEEIMNFVELDEMVDDDSPL